MAKKKQISASLFPEPEIELPKLKSWDEREVKLPEPKPYIKWDNEVKDGFVKKEEVISEPKVIPEPAKPYSDGINNLSEELRRQLFPNKRPPTLRELKQMKNGKL